MGVLFRGFFTASRLRMTERTSGNGRFVKRPYNRKGKALVGAIHESPALEKGKAGGKGRRTRATARVAPTAGNEVQPGPVG